MAFASGQRVTAVMLNRITRNDLSANVTSDTTVTTTETDLAGASISVTTIQPNTKLLITAAIDFEATGSSDFSYVKLMVNGVLDLRNLILQGTGRFALSKTWTVTIASAGTYTIKLRRQKIGTANTVTIYSGHSIFTVSGNGIS